MKARRSTRAQIIPVYMGHTVDLSVEWAGYKAARAALDNVLTAQVSLPRASSPRARPMTCARA